MKQNKKIAITHYISIRFSAIIFIMAAIMILFISYFSNKTIYFDIRRQIRKETHYDFLNIDIRNGKIFVNKNFIFEEDHVQKIILDSQGDFFRGHYPDKKLKNIDGNTGKEIKEENNEMDAVMQTNKMMSWFVPIMSISIAFIAPLGLALYWLISNILMIAERLIIDKVVKS